MRSGLALVPQWRELFPAFTVEETLIAATTAAVGRAPTPLNSVYEPFPVLRERRQIYELPPLRNQGQALLAALETLFAGQPLSPAFA